MVALFKCMLFTLSKGLLVQEASRKLSLINNPIQITNSASTENFWPELQTS